MSKKKKKWELPDENSMEVGCNLIDALMSGDNKVDINSIINEDDSSSHEVDRTLDLLAKRMDEKARSDSEYQPRSVDPINDFIDEERIEEESHEEVVYTDIKVAPSIFEGIQEVPYDYGLPHISVPKLRDIVGDDDYDEELVSVTDSLRVIESDMPGRITIDDGVVAMPFSLDYPRTLDKDITIDNICRAIRDEDGLDNTTKNILDGVAELMHVLISGVVITRHPVAILTEQEFHDYFEAFDIIDIMVWTIVKAGDYYCIIHFPKDERDKLYETADDFVEGMSSNYDNDINDSNERIINNIRFFVALTMSSNEINNKCAYNEDVYVKAILENCNLLSAREVVEMINNDQGTLRVDLEDIMNRNDINDICTRLRVVDHVGSMVGGILDIVDIINGEDDDATIQPDDSDLREAVDEVMSSINNDIDSVINNGSIDVSEFDGETLFNKSDIVDTDAIDDLLDKAITQEDPVIPLSQKSESGDDPIIDDNSMVIPVRRRPTNT